MANKGFALYKRGNDLYILSVAYEYADTRFVGFDDKAEVFKVNKLNDEQKEWLKTHDPKKNDKTKNYIFVKDYYLYRVMFKDFPKGKPYTQLPGGGGVYKETRKFNFVYDLFKNDTILRAIENYGTFNEGYFLIKRLIKEEVEKMLKQVKPAVAFTAVSIEDESEKKKINEVFDSLQEQGMIPENFIRPAFKDGTLDYHMTIKLGELSLGFKKDLNKEVVLNIETVGVSDGAIALGVSGEYFSDNEYQHITLAFKSLPESSKHIQNWKPLEHPFQIKGVIREFTASKRVITRGVFDEANQIQIGNFQAQAVPAGKGSSFPKEEK